MPYMVTFTINIPQMLAYIPNMDPMGNWLANYPCISRSTQLRHHTLTYIIFLTFEYVGPRAERKKSIPDSNVLLGKSIAIRGALQTLHKNNDFVDCIHINCFFFPAPNRKIILGKPSTVWLVTHASSNSVLASRETSYNLWDDTLW